MSEQQVGDVHLSGTSRSVPSVPAAAEVPFAPPRWLTPVRVGIAGLAVGGTAAAVIGAPAFGADAGPVLVASTLAIGLVLAGVGVRTGSARGAAIGCVRAGIVAGVLGTGVLGVLLGTSSALVAVEAARARISRAHDGPDRALVSAGLWLALVATTAFALAPDGARWLSLPLVALGAASAAAGGWRMRARDAWLDAVRRGRVPGWEVVPASDDDRDVPPLVPLPAITPELGLLRHRPPESPLSYRLPPATPMALVRLRPGPTAFDLWRSRVEGALLADPLTACLTALLKGVVVSLLVLAATVTITSVLAWCLCATFWG